LPRIEARKIRLFPYFPFNPRSILCYSDKLLEPPAFGAAFAAGQQMTLAEVVATLQSAERNET